MDIGSLFVCVMVQAYYRIDEQPFEDIEMPTLLFAPLLDLSKSQRTPFS